MTNFPCKNTASKKFFTFFMSAVNAKCMPTSDPYTFQALHSYNIELNIYEKVPMEL